MCLSDRPRQTTTVCSIGHSVDPSARPRWGSSWGSGGQHRVPDSLQLLPDPTPSGVSVWRSLPPFPNLLHGINDLDHTLIRARLDRSDPENRRRRFKPNADSLRLGSNFQVHRRCCHWVRDGSFRKIRLRWGGPVTIGFEFSNHLARGFFISGSERITGHAEVRFAKTRNASGRCPSGAVSRALSF